MTIYATRNPNRKGGWSVPAGSIVSDELRACQSCGTDVNVLTVTTADGPIVMADNIYDSADADETLCGNCKDA